MSTFDRNCNFVYQKAGPLAVKHTSKDVNYAIPHAACSKCAAFSLTVVKFTDSLRQDKM